MGFNLRARCTIASVAWGFISCVETRWRRPGAAPSNGSPVDQANDAVGGDLLGRLAATDRFHGDPGLELGAMGAAFAHGWLPLSGALPRLTG